MPIRWDTKGIGGNVKISLSRDGGKSGTFDTIVESAENNGAYEWTITGSASSNCVLKIEPLSEPDKGTTQGLFSVFYINQPPNIPSNPWPTNGATGVSLDAGLSWAGGDPDPGDTVTYKVYFGTSAEPPEVAAGQLLTAYNPEALNPNTTYYWKVAATDNHGAERVSPLWSFTTLNRSPHAPSDPSPGNGAEHVALDADLDWTGGDPDADDTVTYDVYFGTSAEPPQVVSEQSELIYDPGELNPNTTYYWKIVARDNHGIQIEGPTWQFATIKPGKIEFTATTYDVIENVGAAVITVSRSDGSDGEVSIDFATSEGSAASVMDYIPASGTLTFADGETSKTFIVNIVDDELSEGDETVNLTLIV